MRSRFAAYPLTGMGISLALIAAAATGVFVDNLLAGYAVGVLIAGISLLWRVADPPVLPFMLVVQWVSVTAGYWYARWSGVFPGYYAPGDVERTMAIALSGLLVLALGARVTSHLFEPGAVSGRDAADDDAGWPTAGILRLFAVVMACYAVDYVATINAREFGSLASFVQRVLEFRQVLLATLWLAIIRSRKHGLLLWISFAWAVAPRLGTYYSDFKSPVVLLVLVLAGSWRPWDARWWPRSLAAVAKAAPLVVALLVLLLIWQGGLKRDTRLALDAGALGREPGQRMAFFVRSVRQELPALVANPESYVAALVERVSYITFFSRVLDHVPAREPYAGGELLKMALANAFVPRVLIPDKPELPSDSYYTRRFAGVPVADGATSVSIGYMAEFYADWGLAGMFLSVFFYGCWIGAVAGLMRRWSTVPALRFGALLVVLLAVSDFEHQFIKGFASLNLNAAVTLALLFGLRPVWRRLAGGEAAPDTVAPDTSALDVIAPRGATPETSALDAPRP